MFYLIEIYLIPNEFQEKVSWVLFLGFIIVIIGFFLFITLGPNRENYQLFGFKSLSENLIKLILIIIMSLTYIIPPITFSTTVMDWNKIPTINLIRAIIFIIGCSFLPGACLYKIILPKITLHKRFKVELFLLKITIYPILSYIFIGISVLILDTIGLIKELITLILFLLIFGLFSFDLAIQKIRYHSINLESEVSYVSKYTFIILIVAFGVSLIAIGIHISVEYLIPGDAWIGVGSANFVGNPDVSPTTFGKAHEYPIFWGYVIFGLGSLSGIPYVNANALLAPFCYLSITSMYLFMKSILNKYEEMYAVLSTILVSIFAGIFYHLPENVGSIVISNWGNIPDYILRSQFLFDYKTFAYILLYLSLGLFFSSIETYDNSKKSKLYRTEEFKFILLTSLFLIISFLTYMIPIIIGIYLIFLYCFFSDNKKKKQKNFQFFILFLFLILILFTIFDILLNFFLSYLIHAKYLRVFSKINLKEIEVFLFVYGTLWGFFILIVFIHLFYYKYFYKKEMKLLRFKINTNYIFFTLLSIFTILIFLEIYNIIYRYYVYKYIFIDKNYWYYTICMYLDNIFLNIGIIGIAGIYLSYFCFKKYKNLFYFLISWIIITFVIAFIPITQASLTIDEIDTESYTDAYFFFRRVWEFSIPAFSILTAIGGIKFLKELEKVTILQNFKIFHLNFKIFHLNFKNKNLKSIIKLSIVSFLITSSYSNIIIKGIYLNTDYKMEDEEAQIVGWITKNVVLGSNILTENDYTIYRPIYAFSNNSYYLFKTIFNQKSSNVEQIKDLEEKNIRYAIFYVDGYHPGLSKPDQDFINNYLIEKIFYKRVYKYKNLAVYYAPDLKDNINFESKKYAGTFSFDNDEIGAEPMGWNASTPTANSKVLVKEKFFGHDKVMQIYDDSDVLSTTTFQEFNSSQISGTIEFWIFHSNPYQYVTFRLSKDDTLGLWLYLGINKWMMGSLSEIKEVPHVNSPKLYKWHHVRIDFECGSGGYLGLDRYNVQFIIDGISSGNLVFNERPTRIDKFEIKTGGFQSNYEDLYIDAVGYSWDPNYNIGDNLI